MIKKQCWLYAIQHGSTYFIKIGITTKNPQLRLASLQRGNPLKLELCCACLLESVEDARHAKKQILSEARENGATVSGEWINLYYYTLSSEIKNIMGVINIASFGNGWLKSVKGRSWDVRTAA